MHFNSIEENLRRGCIVANFSLIKVCKPFLGFDSCDSERNLSMLYYVTKKRKQMSALCPCRKSMTDYMSHFEETYVTFSYRGSASGEWQCNEYQRLN